MQHAAAPRPARARGQGAVGVLASGAAISQLQPLLPPGTQPGVLSPSSQFSREASHLDFHVSTEFLLFFITRKVIYLNREYSYMEKYE